LLLAMSGAVRADIKIGQTAAFTGPGAASVQETTEGARLYFDAVNAQGGIKGQRIELISLDDKYEPRLSAANAKTLIDQGVVALFLSRGTAPSQAVLPLLAEYKLPLVAPSTGAMALHEPVNSYVFNLRASFQREAERAVKHLASIGVRRLTIVQVNDDFGNDAGIGALRGLEAVKMRASAICASTATSRAGTADAADRKANVEAVLLIGPGYAVVEGVNALRAAGSTAHVATLSNNASAEFVKALGENARASSSPSCSLRALALHAAGARGPDPGQGAGKSELSRPAGGLRRRQAAGRGLRHAGKEPSREGLLKRWTPAEGRPRRPGAELHSEEPQRPGVHRRVHHRPDGKFWR